MSEHKHCGMMPGESGAKQPCVAAGHAQRSRGGEREQGHELPIKMPAANTKAPPTTTWKAACRKGVSM